MTARPSMPGRKRIDNAKVRETAGNRARAHRSASSRLRPSGGAISGKGPRFVAEFEAVERLFE